MSNRFRIAWALVLAWTQVRGTELPLVQINKDFDVKSLAPHGLEAAIVPADSADAAALKLSTGHSEPWPGVTFKAPGGLWDLSRFMSIQVDVKNTGSNPVQVLCRVDNPGADGVKKCLTDQVMLAPNEQKTLTVALTHRATGQLDVKLFGMNGYPPQVQAAAGQGIDPAAINQLIVFVAQPQVDHQFEILTVRATGEYTPPPPAKDVTAAEFFPFIDTFGQFIHAEWPGKTHSLDELKSRIETESKELQAKPGPPDFDQYGGWNAGPTVDATGFFHPVKHEGKWWLVDPDGKLFFSHGIDCITEWQDTPTDERDTWFQDFPGAKPEFHEFAGKAWSVSLHGHYQGKKPATFSFSGANLKRKYGDDWRKKFAELAHLRLRSWGLNTIGAWSTSRVYELHKTPYTVSLGAGGKYIEGSEGYWAKFHDVFDPSFEQTVRKQVSDQKGKSAGDPWCIGYFIDNELSWGDGVSLAISALKSPPDQPAKQAFLADLKTKYEDIAKLNAVWGSAYASWDALAQSRTAPDKNEAGEDLGAFYSKLAEQYFRICKEAVKDSAPKQLYLGCRFADVNVRAAAAAAKFCDVVTFNLYRRSIAGFEYPSKADVPMLVGEFHCGALDRGMFHTGLVACQTQAERAAMYKSYVEGALKHPQFVGVHWFQYMDEPTTGRSLDGENYQIGFVDHCDTPYPETIEAAREVGYRLYQIRSEQGLGAK